MRPIDADALLLDIQNCCSSTQFSRGTAKLCIRHAPTLDLVQPVRCRECEAYGKNLGTTIDDSRCHNFPSTCYGHFVTEDFYCANGKRKEQKCQN